MVEEGRRPVAGYHANWMPHMWRVRVSKITDSPMYSDIIDNGDDIAKKVVAFFIKHIKEYVEGIIEVDVIDDIPPDTDSEIMVYAPDDIYLISSHKKDP